MSGARRSRRLLARFEEVAGDNGGEDAPNLVEARGYGRRGGREEDSVEAEESEEVEEAEAKEGVDPQMTPKESKSRCLSLSRT
jgi:hypothetical protein